jgi:hypothetical protein
MDDPSNMDDAARERQARRYFALDPAGRPRFVYYHTNTEVDPNGVGAYYAACDNQCTTAGNWSHTRITSVEDWSGTLEWELLEEPVLTFSAEGKPRILAKMLPLGILRFPGLYYVSCDEQCDVTENWLKTQIGNGDDASGFYDMALDGEGRPFVVISFWWQDVLRYGWCDSFCTDFSSWQVVNGPLLEVESHDLEMDAQGRPRLIYTTTEFDETGNNESLNLYALWCNSDCRTAEALWEKAFIEASGHQSEEWPTILPAVCAEGKWHPLVPTLALGGAGNAQLAIDISYVGKCDYDAGSGQWVPGEQFSYSTVWRAARTVNFAMP